jgi:L-rhamnose mutarotase
MNNVDIAIGKVRELQTMIFDHNTSNNSLFLKTEEVMMYMNKASKEIQTNYETISEQLTRELNTGVKQ